MDWLHWNTIDWAATGTMLQGIGAMIGAIAVIVAAWIGSGTLRSWRRQQIFQKHMELAERILTLVIRAKEEIRFVRSPLKTAAELTEAGRNLEANGTDKSAMPASTWNQLCSAQVTFDRLARYQTTWSELQEVKPLGFVYFGELVTDNIDRIINKIHLISVDAQGYADDDHTDLDYSRSLINTLSFGRSKGQADELGIEVDNAVAAIRDRLQPLLQDVADATNKAVNEFLLEILKGSATRLLRFI